MSVDRIGRGATLQLPLLPRCLKNTDNLVDAPFDSVESFIDPVEAHRVGFLAGFEAGNRVALLTEITKK